VSGRDVGVGDVRADETGSAGDDDPQRTVPLN
jgi:hypothetical protein